MKTNQKQRGGRSSRTALLTAILAIVTGAVAVASRWISPGFRDFCEAAAPWVLMGLGLAGSMAAMGKDPEDRQG